MNDTRYQFIKATNMKKGGAFKTTKNRWYKYSTTSYSWGYYQNKKNN